METKDQAETETVQTSSRRDTVLGRSVGMLIAPAETLREAIQKRRVGEALAVTLVIGAGDGAAFLAFRSQAPYFSLAGAAVGATLGLFLIAYVTSVATLLCHMMVRFMGHEGEYKGLFAGFGHINALLIFFVPWAFIVAIGGVPGDILGKLGELAVTAWFFVLAVIAIRENYKVGAGTAIAAMALGSIAAVMSLLIVVAALIFLALLGLQVLLW